MPAMTLIPSPMPNAEQQIQLATDELIATAQALIRLEAPTLSPEALHAWLLSPEEPLPFPAGDEKPSEETLTT